MGDTLRFVRGSAAVLAALALFAVACGDDRSADDDESAATSVRVASTSTIPDPISPSTSTSLRTTSTSMRRAPSTAPQHVRSNGTRPDDAIARSEPVDLSLTLDRTDVPSGDTITATLVATNRGDAEVDITHPCSTPVRGGIYFDGRPAGEPAPACAAVVSPDRLGPRETRRWRLELRVRSSGPEPGRLKPGVYDVFTGIYTYGTRGDNASSGGNWYAPGAQLSVR